MLTASFDSEYGECLDFQFDFPLASIRWEKTVDFNASPASPSNSVSSDLIISKSKRGSCRIFECYRDFRSVRFAFHQLA